jgi:lipid II:glycine glycyltransferase (peptidoglycan interpeptide bridge formation enzyme)
MKYQFEGYKVEIDSIQEAKWEQLLPEFDDSSIHQAWSSGKMQWGERNLSHLILKRDGKVVAMAQIGIKKLPVVKVGVATVYWGPLWRRNGKQEDYDILDKMIEALKNEYANKRGLMLRIWPIGFEVLDKRTISIINNHGFRRNLAILPYRTILLNLSAPLDELRKNFDQKWRNKLNAAEKQNLNIVDGDSIELYNGFLKMLKETVLRKKFETRIDYNAYRRIQCELPEFLKLKVFVCNFEGKPVSGGVFSAIGKTGNYLLGATANSGLRVNGSNLIQWCAIKWFKEKGCLWYDLGGIDPCGNPGVYHFKLGVAGKKGMDVTHIGQFYIGNKLICYFLNSFIDLSNYCRLEFGKMIGLLYKRRKT